VTEVKLGAASGDPANSPDKVIDDLFASPGLTTTGEIGAQGTNTIPRLYMMAAIVMEKQFRKQPMAEKGCLAVVSLLKEKGPLRTMVLTKPIIRQSSDPAVLGADSVRHGSDLRGEQRHWVFLVLWFKRTWVTRITSFWHNQGFR
jgi:hypothetical protein